MIWLTAMECLCHKRSRISSVCRNLNPVLSSFLTYHRVCNRSNTTDATCMTGEVVGDTKGVIKIRISKNRQHNGQKIKQRSTKHTYKTKDRETRILIKTEGELRCSGRVRSSCSTSDIRRVNLVTNPVINREWGKDLELFMTSGTYPWSFVTQIFHNGQPSHGGDRKMFEVMTSSLLASSNPLGTALFRFVVGFMLLDH